MVYEMKDANKSFVLASDDLLTLHQRARRQGKEGYMVINFTGIRMVAFIHLMNLEDV